MKIGDKILIKATNEITTIFDFPQVEDRESYIYAKIEGELKIYFGDEFYLLSDITILDEYKEVESDIVFTGEDSEGSLLEITIPTVDIANYFEVEEIRIDEDADYQGAAQFVFDAWVQDSKQHDIEIKQLITTK